MSDIRNLAVTLILSVIILFSWQYFYEAPRLKQQQEKIQAEVKPTVAAQTSEAAIKDLPREEVIKSSGRVQIENSKLRGSLSLKGARFDDLVLKHYHDTVNPTSPEVVLLTPSHTKNSYFAEFGWISDDKTIPLPTEETIWHSNHTLLESDKNELHLHWDNQAGLIFNIYLKLDDNYMFEVKQVVENNTGRNINIADYGLVSKVMENNHASNTILHEGAIGVLNGKLCEEDYQSLRKHPKYDYKNNQEGWFGITDKYWLTAIIPQKTNEFNASFSTYPLDNSHSRHQVDYLSKMQSIPSGDKLSATNRFFAGAKKLRLLDNYAARYDITLFDRAVDFGWFYFLTKPLFNVLQYLHSLLGNFGLAILFITVIIKLVLFPLANKSYQSMSKIKQLQPKITELKERCGDDKMKLNQEMVELYKRENVNPLSGCLPLLVQIPVFFSLYKVIFVTIEMRHAPFFGWIKDLSAPDPTSIFNLFGLLPWQPPSFLIIGVWPIVMAITMYLQQRMSPEPADPVQAQVMRFIPLIFLFMFSSFPAGLIIYWAWSNILSILQQFVINSHMK
jgi:YidC/Oxa1 family membrane protein insertase